jgi:protein neuralized
MLRTALLTNLVQFVCRYAYPDLTNEQGYWAKTVPESCAQRGTTLFFYIVVGTGEVRYGYNGQEVGVFFTGVQTNTPLWALLDLYGSTSAVEYVGR